MESQEERSQIECAHSCLRMVDCQAYSFDAEISKCLLLNMTGSSGAQEVMLTAHILDAQLYDDLVSLICELCHRLDDSFYWILMPR